MTSAEIPLCLLGRHDPLVAARDFDVALLSPLYVCALCTCVHALQGINVIIIGMYGKSL